MKKNWVYYMQKGLKSIWKKKEVPDYRREKNLAKLYNQEKNLLQQKKEEKVFELGDDNWATPDDKKNDEEHLKNIRSEEEYPYNIEFGDGRTKEEMDKMQDELMECGCLPDCGCKEK